MSNRPEAVKQFKRIGVVGAGNMGSMMALAFSEIGLDVSIWDAKGDNVDSFAKQIQETKGLKGKIEPFHDVGEFTHSLHGEGGRKLFIFSITHGNPADLVLSQIKQELKRGDIILDGGNEHYRNTERRQKECEEIGVSWIGMGVSGGYQSARHGPSMSPGEIRMRWMESCPFWNYTQPRIRRRACHVLRTWDLVARAITSR